MQRTIDPLRDLKYCGVDIYMEVVYLLEQRLSDGDVQQPEKCKVTITATIFLFPLTITFIYYVTMTKVLSL